ncbi:MAG: hypothetical protein K940chlam3_01765, partial [Chlamydiae bacterium]|nr:hypothetical protein [Chlamydiota bacterium]
MEANWKPNFLERVCPYLMNTIESSSSEDSELEERVGYYVNQQEGFQGLGRWALNSIRWVWSVRSSGGIDFFVDQMYHPETGGFDEYKWVSVAHKLRAIAFANLKYWNLFNQRKGEKAIGGAELATLGKYAIGDHTPLTIDSISYHKEIKKLCTRNLFGLNMIKRHFPAIYDVADSYFDYTCFSKYSPVKVDLSDVIIKYLLRANGIAIFGPPGSKSYEYIRDILFCEDGSPNPEWDQVSRSVEEVGQFVSDAILFSPKYFLNRTFDEIISLVKKSGLVDESLLPEIVYRKHAHIIEAAAKRIRQASERALSSTVIPEKHGSKDVQGMIELMLASGYTDEEIDGMIRLLFVVGQRTTAVTIESCFKNLIMYPEWQDRLYAEISEGLRGKEFNYDNINALEHLDN